MFAVYLLVIVKRKWNYGALKNRYLLLTAIFSLIFIFRVKKYVLYDGIIQEEGKYNELLNMNGYFTKLYKLAR